MCSCASFTQSLNLSSVIGTDKDGVAYDTCEINASGIERIFIPVGHYLNENTIKTTKHEYTNTIRIKEKNTADTIVSDESRSKYHRKYCRIRAAAFTG